MTGRLGNYSAGIERVRHLNRIITWNGREVDVEADPRHQENAARVEIANGIKGSGDAGSEKRSKQE